MLRSPTKGVPLLLDGLWNQFNIGVNSETKEQERSDDAWSLDREVEVEPRQESHANCFRGINRFVLNADSYAMKDITKFGQPHKYVHLELKPRHFSTPPQAKAIFASNTSEDIQSTAPRM